VRATREERRLSPLDAAFLYLERPNQLLHVGCVALLDGPVPFDAFAAMLDRRLGALRRYHQRPVRPPLDLDRPRWEDDPGFDVRRHARHLAVPPPGGAAELRELIDTFFATPFDRHRPLWEFYLIEGLSGGRCALLCKVHHCMIDGVSGAQVLEAITDAASDAEPLAPLALRRPPLPARTAPVDGPRAATGPGREPLSRLRAAFRLLTSPALAWARAREAAEAAATLASFAREPASPLPFNGTLSDARRIVWTSFMLDDFLAMRGAAGCKVNDVVLAVIAGALRRYLEGRGLRPDALRVRAMVPVSERRQADHLALGNLVSAMFPTLPVDVADPVERLRRVAAETRALKERGQPQASSLVLALLGALPAPLGALLARAVPERPFLSTICTNVPGSHQVRSLLGRRILDVHPIVPLLQGMGLEFAIMSHAGRLSITVNSDPALVPDAERMRAHLLESAAELRAALGASAAARRPLPGTLDTGPRVADLMTREVVTIAPQDSLARAWALMRFKRIRHMPVLDGERLVGLVTHRDLLAASTSSLASPAEEARVSLLARHSAVDVMETHLSTAAPEEPAAEAGQRMVRHKIGCLPVVREGTLVGIVTEEDFLRWATERMTCAPAPA